MNKTTTANRVKTRILIVDDHPLVRHGMAELISSEPELEVCGEADDAPEALQMLDELHPDLIIIDISLKTGNGIELVKQIKSRSTSVKMLIASMHDENLFAERALRAGAMGYVNKQESPDKMIEAIYQIINGQVYLSNNMADQLLQRVVSGGASADRSSIESLSDRELEVFTLIGEGLTTRQVANRLRRSVKTIETYRENIKAKLNLQTGAELSRHAVQWALENG